MTGDLVRENLFGLKNTAIAVWTRKKGSQSQSEICPLFCGCTHEPQQNMAKAPYHQPSGACQKFPASLHVSTVERTPRLEFPKMPKCEVPGELIERWI